MEKQITVYVEKKKVIWDWFHWYVWKCKYISKASAKGIKSSSIWYIPPFLLAQGYIQILPSLIFKTFSHAQLLLVLEATADGKCGLFDIPR